MNSELPAPPPAGPAGTQLRHRDPRRYEFVGEHGRGGLGRVYRARDTELDRVVALKELLRPSHGAETRFVREVLVTARLEHPGVVPIHEAGRWPNGVPFYAMKLVSGRPLSELLSQAETPDQRIALLPHLIAVADAMAYAHDRKVIHRDLKPSNIIVGDYGETVVIDWGLAKELTDASEEDVESGPYRTAATSDLTAVGAALGTPAYMSPEQARGEKVDTRTDVYALGAILFQLGTGTAPPADSTEDERRRALRSVPEDLATIALKALSPSPDNRYDDASAVAADLRAYDAGVRIAARRYSLGAMLGLWIRRHKRIAVAVAIPSIVAVIIGVVSLREIVARGDREAAAKREAEKAKSVAEKERDVAIYAQGALLLEKDPTRARDLLGQREAKTANEALLKARALASATAEQVVSFLPYYTWDAVPSEGLETIALSASDKKLRIIDLSSGSTSILDERLVAPPILIREGGGYTYVRHGPTGRELVQALNPSKPIPLQSAWESPDRGAIPTAEGLYMLGASGNLALLTPSGHYRPIASGIRGIVRYGDGLLGCTTNNLLRLTPGGPISRLGSCRHSGGWRDFAANGNVYAVQATPSTVAIGQNGRQRTLRLQGTNQFFVGSDGLVVGANAKARRSWYVVPGANQAADGPSTDAIPTAIGADGHLAAWGYMDGTARVRDTITGATWTFTGHSTSIYWIFVSERDRRIVTVGGPEVRSWRIPSQSVHSIGATRRGGQNAASSPDGRWTIFDDHDGSVAIIANNEPAAGVRILHQHDDVAFGLAWRGNEACSSGRDGKVICTDIGTSGHAKVVAKHIRPIRFLDGSDDKLAYTVEDGSVWAHVQGDAAPSLLYVHAAEPFRVAISDSGDVASGADDGSVIVYEWITGRVYRAKSQHTARVYQLHWQADRLVTSSSDGTVRIWSKTLELISIHSANQPIRDLELLDSGWVANVGATELWLHQEGTDMKIYTGPAISDLATSPDRRFVGAVVNRDLILYDMRDNAVAAVRVGDAEPSCIHFWNAKRALLCGSSILSVSVEDLTFVRIAKGVPDHETKASIRQ